MSDKMKGSMSELEEFRQQWKEEVSARTRKTDKRPSQGESSGKTRRASDGRPERLINKPPTRHPAADVANESGHDGDDQQPGDRMIRRIEGLAVREVDEDDFSIMPGSSSEPQSALEHYERAVEKESQGNLGDSLSHYRKAYRLDARVDQSYRNKHFPAKPPPTNVNPSNAAVTVPSTAHHSSKEPHESMSISQLINSFADTPMTGAAPIIEGDRSPPCPIKKLPAEVLLDLLLHVGVHDPATLVRLSLVCKKLAYHVWTENPLWKRVALGPEFGLASQRYHFATDLQGREAIFKALEENSAEEVVPPLSEFEFPKDTLWREIFHNHPRIRFSGVYISTVNYTRPGGASATQHVWSNPVHIVTYYRYLRFFRDGTCISLLTTNEPVEVVHHLTPENLTLVRGSKKDQVHSVNFTSASAHTPTNKDSISTGGIVSAPPAAHAVMKHALRGRWRLCHPALVGTSTASPESGPTMAAGDLHIETEGAGPRYMYTMLLSLKSSSRSKNATKNNKLQWKGFWSYDSLTDDWAEFQLKNDKPFYFSRVKSYGLGY